MPVFQRQDCGTVENTATSRYWVRSYRLPQGAPVPKAQCSQCDPKIGKWHGQFPRKTAQDLGLHLGEDGFLYSPKDQVTHTRLIGPAPVIHV